MHNHAFEHKQTKQAKANGCYTPLFWVSTNKHRITITKESVFFSNSMFIRI